MSPSNKSLFSDSTPLPAPLMMRLTMYHLLRMATENEPPSLSELKSMKKIMELPIVSEGAKHFTAFYRDPARWMWNKTKEGAKAAGWQAVAPYVDERIRAADESLANAIDRATERAPILKEQPQVILDSAKEKIPEMRNAVDPYIQSAKEKGNTLLDYGNKGYEGASSVVTSVFGLRGQQPAPPPVATPEAPPPAQTSTLWEMFFGK